MDHSNADISYWWNQEIDNFIIYESIIGLYDTHQTGRRGRSVLHQQIL